MTNPHRWRRLIVAQQELGWRPQQRVSPHAPPPRRTLTDYESTVGSCLGWLAVVRGPLLVQSSADSSSGMPVSGWEQRVTAVPAPSRSTVQHSLRRWWSPPSTGGPSRHLADTEPRGNVPHRGHLTAVPTVGKLLYRRSRSDAPGHRRRRSATRRGNRRTQLLRPTRHDVGSPDRLSGSLPRSR